MAKKNTIIAAGLNGLLAPAAPVAPAVEPEQAAAAEQPAKGNYKTVCYSIPPEVAEYMRYIARYDRKKINAVVVEAFAAYINSWRPAPQEKPKKLTV